MSGNMELATEGAVDSSKREIGEEEEEEGKKEKEREKEMEKGEGEGEEEEEGEKYDFSNNYYIGHY